MSFNLSSSLDTTISAGQGIIGSLNTQLSFNLQGTLDTTSTTALASIAKFPCVWRSEAATLLSINAKVLTAVSTGTAPSFNIKIDGTDALSSDLSVNETWASGTVDTNNNSIATGDTIEIDFNKGNGDAEDLIVELVFRYQ